MFEISHGIDANSNARNRISGVAQMKQLALFAGCALAFVAACLGESALRGTQRTAIPVTVPRGLQARISAFVRPDFLWVGDDWWINIESDTPLNLSIDGEWQAVIPSGSHTLSSNHDVNNTSDYGPAWFATPQSISVTGVEE